MSSRIDLLTLKLIVATIEEKSLAKAADRHHIAISALSKRISDLERAFKVQLLHRMHKGIEPTAAGLALLAHARIINRDVAQLEEELSEYAEGVRGHVRIFANETTAFGFLPEDLSIFMQKYPLVRVEFQTKNNQTVVQAVIENAADIGIFAGDVPASELEVFFYRRDQLVVLVPKAHALSQRDKVSFSELLEYELIEHEPRSAIETHMLHAANNLGKPLKTRIRVTSLDTACRMVEAGLGIAIVTDQFSIRLAPTMAIASVRLDEPWASRQHKVGTRRISDLPVAANLLLEHLRNCVAASPVANGKSTS
jgi:DNA-binding transcriptional LysR family regulator